MMSKQRDYAYRAGRLLQWGLQPRLRPAQDDEYMDLVNAWIEDRAFRDVVEEVASGLGLHLLDVSTQGVVLAPATGSIFRMRFTEYRSASSSVDDRLLDGLVQMAIAATVFPRAEDLMDDLSAARPALRVEEVEDQLRTISDALSRQADGDDPTVREERGQLMEAWRVYNDRISARELSGGGRPRRATTAIIEFALDRLREFGCFVRVDQEGQTLWQPTRRYNVMVQELAATRLFQELEALVEAASDAAPLQASQDQEER